jgi:hypothetical protein
VPEEIDWEDPHSEAVILHAIRMAVLRGVDDERVVDQFLISQEGLEALRERALKGEGSCQSDCQCWRAVKQ